MGVIPVIMDPPSGDKTLHQYELPPASAGVGGTSQIRLLPNEFSAKASEVGDVTPG